MNPFDFPMQSGGPPSLTIEMAPGGTVAAILLVTLILSLLGLLSCREAGLPLAVLRQWLSRATAVAVGWRRFSANAHLTLPEERNPPS